MVMFISIISPPLLRQGVLSGFAVFLEFVAAPLMQKKLEAEKAEVCENALARAWLLSEPGFSIFLRAYPCTCSLKVRGVQGKPESEYRRTLRLRQEALEKAAAEKNAQ
jgi:hypothetical protein